MNEIIHKHSAGGVIVHDNKVLIISSIFHGTTDLPKGTVEPGESLETTAIREVEEETGYRTRITADLGSIAYNFTNKKDSQQYRKTVSYFLMELADLDKPVKSLQDGEDFENEWCTFEDALKQLSFEEARSIVRKAQALS